MCCNDSLNSKETCEVKTLQRKRITPDDIKVRVVFSEEYRERYTKACLDVLDKREKFPNTTVCKQDGAKENN